MKCVPRRTTWALGRQILWLLSLLLKHWQPFVPKWNACKWPTLRSRDKAQLAPRSPLCPFQTPPVQDPSFTWLLTARIGCACLSSSSDYSHIICSPLCLILWVSILFIPVILSSCSSFSLKCSVPCLINTFQLAYSLYYGWAFGGFIVWAYGHFQYMYIWWIYTHIFLLATCLEVELQGHSLSTWATLKNRVKLFSKIFAIIYTPICKILSCPSSLSTLGIVRLFHFSHPSVCQFLHLKYI